MQIAGLLLLLLLVALPARAQDAEHPKDITKSGTIFLEACCLRPRLQVAARAVLGGLHHEYRWERIAA